MFRPKARLVLSSRNGVLPRLLGWKGRAYSPKILSGCPPPFTGREGKKGTRRCNPRAGGRFSGRNGQPSPVRACVTPLLRGGSSRQCYQQFVCTEHWSNSATPVCRVGPQRGTNPLALFSRPPAEPCMHLSMHTALQFSLSSIRLSCGFSCGYSPMPFPTYHQGLATHGYHHLYPQWFFPSSLSLEVTEVTDMMDRDVIFAPAEFTGVPK